MIKPGSRYISLFCLLLIFSCSDKKSSSTEKIEEDKGINELVESVKSKVNQYETVRLTADLTNLTNNEKKMIPILIEAAKIMDDIFWKEAFGDKDSLLSSLDDEHLKRFSLINYGPWDRLNNNEPFVPGFGKKPEGANFYPKDMTKEEFEKSSLEDKKSQYTILRRDQENNLISVPYHVAFKEEVEKVSALLSQAAELADDSGLKNYLNLRAESFLNDNYQPSDLAWMDMKNNIIDVVIGPIENYEDKLFGYKTAHEAYVLIKDKSWSDKLAKYAAFLPELQRNLPVPQAYKKERPGTDADLNAYDVIYYAGDCNAGSKTIAINLPNDEEVQLKKGTRRLQLKNAMEAKFNKIMIPIADLIIDKGQQKHINFNAFFANTMFHEVAHGLGIKNTVNGKGSVREALKENASALEEGKADILGLYMISQLHKKGQIEGELMDYYVTFMAGIFRSVRFGSASAHGTANMIRFNYFKDLGAFDRDDVTGRYKINFKKMGEAMNSLSEEILKLQGDGDYEGVAKLVDEKGKIDLDLQSDLNKISQAEIPVDIIFEQGIEVLEGGSE